MKSRIAPASPVDYPAFDIGVARRQAFPQVTISLPGEILRRIPVGSARHVSMETAVQRQYIPIQ